MKVTDKDLVASAGKDTQLGDMSLISGTETGRRKEPTLQM